MLFLFSQQCDETICAVCWKTTAGAYFLLKTLESARLAEGQKLSALRVPKVMPRAGKALTDG
jgi:hypothetical protein